MFQLNRLTGGPRLALGVGAVVTLVALMALMALMAPIALMTAIVAMTVQRLQHLNTNIAKGVALQRRAAAADNWRGLVHLNAGRELAIAKTGYSHSAPVR